MSEFTDIHSHLIYGVDDGAKTREEMEAMLDAAHADGIAFLFATPHVTPGVEPFDQALYEARLEEARAYCRRKGYDMALYPGAEILYTPWMEQYAARRRLPTLAGSDYLLLECVPDIAYAELDAALSFLERAGYVTVLAHVERYKCLRGRGAYRLRARHDIRYQVNCAAVLGGHGFFADRRVLKWLRAGLIDFVASDSHNCHGRPTRMRQAYARLVRQCGREAAARMMRAGRQPRS